MEERILVVDDDCDQCTLLAVALTNCGYYVDTATSAEEAVLLAERQQFAVILTDIQMHEMSGLALCRHLRDRAPEIPVIVITGSGNTEMVVSAMHAGAYDYLSKPVDRRLLAIRVARAMQRTRLLLALRRVSLAHQPAPLDAQDVSLEPSHAKTWFGTSPPMERVRELIARLARSEASVLIQGETGTGKELVAHALHDASTRSGRPFVAINCAAVPAHLLESELFGHAKGAFTDAKTSRTGLFLEASGGTLLLDEIGEMPQEMQAKLLRALQERTVRPVGGAGEVPFDVRILAATHRNLELEVEAKRFRQDLLYRINVVCVDVPALRDCVGDILPLAVHFLERSSMRARRSPIALSEAVAERLLAYDWPGNVRELQNGMERLVALARSGQTSLADLPAQIRGFGADPRSRPLQVRDIVHISELQRRYVFQVIERVKGNKTLAARLLGLHRRSLYRLLAVYRQPGARASGNQACSS